MTCNTNPRQLGALALVLMLAVTAQAVAEPLEGAAKAPAAALTLLPSTFDLPPIKATVPWQTPRHYKPSKEQRVMLAAIFGGCLGAMLATKSEAEGARRHIRFPLGFGVGAAAGVMLASHR